MDYLFLYVLFLHWVGDFVLQSHTMSVNKSKNWGVLTFHVGVYSFTLWIGLLLTNLVSPLEPLLTEKFLVITFFTHFLTDAITSRITSRLWAAGQTHNFFVMIGLDQFIHFVTLFVALRWLLTGGW